MVTKKELKARYKPCFDWLRDNFGQLWDDEERPSLFDYTCEQMVKGNSDIAFDAPCDLYEAMAIDLFIYLFGVDPHYIKLEERDAKRKALNEAARKLVEERRTKTDDSNH